MYPQIIHLNKIFPYQPSSYWATPMAMETPIYPLVNVYSLQLKMAIDIVDLPIKNADIFHSYIIVFQRVKLHFSYGFPMVFPWIHHSPHGFTGSLDSPNPTSVASAASWPHRACRSRVSSCWSSRVEARAERAWSSSCRTHQRSPPGEIRGKPIEIGIYDRKKKDFNFKTITI